MIHSVLCTETRLIGTYLDPPWSLVAAGLGIPARLIFVEAGGLGGGGGASMRLHQLTMASNSNGQQEH